MVFRLPSSRRRRRRPRSAAIVMTIVPFRQGVHPHGDVGFCQVADLHDVPGGVARRIVGQEEEDVRLQLGQAVALQQGKEQQAVELAGAFQAGKKCGEQAAHFLWFVFELI